MKAAFSGRSSGALFWQARATIDNEPNFTVCPTGASNREIRAVILSSPCNTAIGSAVIAGPAPLASTAPPAAISAADDRASLIGCRG